MSRRAACAIALALAGCSSSGAPGPVADAAVPVVDAPAPGPEAAAPEARTPDARVPDAAVPTPDAAAGDTVARDATGAFTLTSSAFREGEVVPLLYRCMQPNVSPPLVWTGAPAGARGFAVTMIHAAADMSLHWVLWDVSADVTSLPMDVAKVALPPTPAGAKQARPNIDGATWYGYTGPCPHSANNSYRFTVYALDVATLPGVTPQSTTGAVDAAIQAHQIARASLTGKASN